jgi:hypothetical protein
MRVPDTEFGKPVVDTFEVSGLDPARCILHGGAALGMFGVRKPGDLDVLLEPGYFNEIAEPGQTPNGVAVTTTDAISGRKHMVSVGAPLEASGEELLRLDLSTFTLLGGGSLRFRHKLTYAEEFEYARGVLRVRPLLDLLGQKQASRRRRDVIDSWLIQGFLQRAEESHSTV